MTKQPHLNFHFQLDWGVTRLSFSEVLGHEKCPAWPSSATSCSNGVLLLALTNFTTGSRPSSSIKWKDATLPSAC